LAIRIIIIDDHGLIRAGLRALLEVEPEIQVVGEGENGEEALRLTGELQPDLVLLDVGMPGMDGIETTRRLMRLNPKIRVLILTVYEEESLLREAIQAGAGGYILKRAAEEELVTAIRAVDRGDMYVHPAMTRFLFKDMGLQSSSRHDGLEELTPREREVMGYIVRGFTNRQIAEMLYISQRTVEGHRASLFGKLGLKTRVELVEYVEKHGLTD
jgi:DNA-binding NarL/FixJ family response regulator